MADRKVKQAVTGQRTVDGAGVHLTRVLGYGTVKDFDPWLMLDSFDSANPQDYVAGFPPHPHRGIETVTYLVEGEMNHGDSLGNKGVLHGGESQWMTAGSGIIHEEMPQAVPRMLGVQLWLNLPAKDKMTPPKYFSIHQDMIPDVTTEFGEVRVVSGNYNGTTGVHTEHVHATLLDVSVTAGQEAVIPVPAGENAFIFLLQGDVQVAGQRYAEKSAVLFEEAGDTLRVQAPEEAAARFLVCTGQPLHEEFAWGGPIVMNTQAELREAFKELEDGNFIKHNAVGE